MARPSSASVSQLLELLRSGDPVPAGELVEKLAVSRPVLSRLVAEAGDQVRRVGRARATAYVATALVRPNTWPLYRMNPDVHMEELGTLHALRGDRFLFEPTGDHPNLLRHVDGPAGYFPGLPWFLDDVRPQGFLGRSMAHRLGRALGVSVDLKSWQSRDNLLGILHGGTRSVTCCWGRPPSTVRCWMWMRHRIGWTWIAGTRSTPYAPGTPSMART